jgi:Bacterial Ig domain
MKIRRAWAILAALCAAACGDKGPVGPESNRAPEIRSLSISPAVIPLGGSAVVSVDASDPDGDQVFYRFEAGAGSITADPAQPGRATYRNDGVVRASDQVRVTVTDSKNASASGVASVTLQANRSPTINLRTLVAERACHPECSLTVLANADDADGDALRYTWSGCTSGSEPTSRCVIDAPGSHTAALVVEDGRGGVATGSITMEGRNAAPVVSGGHVVHGTGPVRFLIESDDADGDKLLCGWWGNCQCTGSNQSFNLECSLPSGLDRCFMRFSCSDPFGASSETLFELVR